MIPRIGKGGGSLVDATQYYAHDRAERGLASTSDRVEWVVSLNLPIDPERGSKAEQIEAMKKCAVVMQWTADHQADIKRAAGGSSAGRKLEKPAYTYSLSWAPDEKPSKAEMLAAAKETLKLLRMREHQVLIVAHNDTPHPHVHVIVNRVHPETGLTSFKIREDANKRPVMRSKTSCDRLLLSKWAEDYERRNGRILVEQRADNNAARAANKATYNKLRSPGDPDKIVKAFNLTREERARVRAYGSKSDKKIRSERGDQQEAERKQLSGRHTQRRSLLDADIAKTYGERQKALTDELRATNARISAKGWFRQAIRRVTGHHQADIAQATLLRKSLNDLDARVAERRGEILAGISHEKIRLDRRHENERARDEAFIAGRAKVREEAREAHALSERSEPKRKSRRGTRGENRQEGRTRDRSEERKAAREEDKASRSASAKEDADPKQKRIAQLKAMLEKSDRKRDRSRDR